MQTTLPPDTDIAGVLAQSAALGVLDGYITRKQLSVALGISERTLQRYDAARIGPPPVSVGRQRYYRLASVRDWLASCERPNPRRR